MEVSGKVKVINPVQQVSASFKKRELVVTTEEQYPQHIMIEFTQDKCDLLNNYNSGDAVKVSINLRGRNGPILRGKLNISIQYKGGELRNFKAKLYQHNYLQFQLQQHLSQPLILLRRNMMIYRFSFRL